MFVLLLYLYCDSSPVTCAYLCYDIGINICVAKPEVYVFRSDLKCPRKTLKKSGYDDMDRSDSGEKRQLKLLITRHNARSQKHSN